MSYASELTFEGKNIYTGTAQALTGALDVRKYKRLAFSISGLTVETVSLDISFDGNTWFLGVMPTDLVKNANATLPLTNGIYSFGGGNLPCAFIRLTKSSTTENATARVGFGN